MNYAKTNWRYYRDSKSKVKHLVSKWNEDDPVKFILNLGDLIDGQAKHNGGSETSLADILNCLGEFSGNVYHAWGNHDFYNFKRDILMTQHGLNSANAVRKNLIKPDGIFYSPEQHAYYSFVPHPMLRIIVLDHYEFSALGRDDGDQLYIRAMAFLKSKNTNDDLNSSDGLHGTEQRYAQYNGAPSVTQLLWLENQLKDAESEKQYVIVSGHVPIYEKAADESCLLWNYESVLEVLHRYKNVVAHLAGHDHNGGYAVDKKGIHHLTMNGLIEAEPGTLDSANFYLYSSKLVVEGRGRVPSFVIELPNIF